MLTLTGANGFTGGFTLASGGGTLNANSNTSLGNGNVTVTGGSLVQGSNNLTITGSYTQTATAANSFTCSAPQTYTLTVGGSFAIPTASGTIAFNRFTGSGPYTIYDVYGLQAMEESLSVPLSLTIISTLQARSTGTRARALCR